MRLNCNTLCRLHNFTCHNIYLMTRMTSFRSGEAGLAMVSLIGDERGGQQHGDEMTFSNIAGVLPVVDKVSSEQYNVK